MKSTSSLPNGQTHSRKVQPAPLETSSTVAKIVKIQHPLVEKLNPVSHQDPLPKLVPVTSNELRQAKLRNTPLKKPPQSKGNQRLSFPAKVYELLRQQKYSTIISWDKEGRSFTVHNRKRFELEVMPEVFRTAKFASFQRQLCLYGFIRKETNGDSLSNTNPITYYHPQFLFKHRAQAMSIIRKKIALNRQPLSRKTAIDAKTQNNKTNAPIKRPSSLDPTLTKKATTGEHSVAAKPQSDTQGVLKKPIDNGQPIHKKHQPINRHQPQTIDPELGLTQELGTKKVIKQAATNPYTALDQISLERLIDVVLEDIPEFIYKKNSTETHDMISQNLLFMEYPIEPTYPDPINHLALAFINEPSLEDYWDT